MRPVRFRCGGGHSANRLRDLRSTPSIHGNIRCPPVNWECLRRRAVPARVATTVHAIDGISRLDEDPGIRINKCFKTSHSRRQADKLIDSGRVTVNGKVATLGFRVKRGDNVTLDGKPVNWSKHNEESSRSATTEHVYIKYWKPKGVVCTTDRTIKGNVIDEIKHPKRIFMVGRLDKDTTGLLLLTDDGRLVNALLRSQHAHYKTYLVRVERALKVAALRSLRRGVTITTYSQRDGNSKALTAPTLPAQVQQVDMQTFMITITEGRNRQVRKMCEAVGYKVIGLHREDVAGITLDGMKPGDWKEVGRRDRRIIERVLSSASQGSNHRALQANKAQPVA